MMLHRIWVMAALVLGLAACQDPGATADEAAGAILTVYGEIGAGARGPVDPITEPLFRGFGLEFEAARTFNRAGFSHLDQHVVETDYPLGGPVRRFSGPLLRDVLELADPQGDVLIVTALDGYQREIALQRVHDHDVILALQIDGQALGLGGFGPAMLAWPRGSDPALAGMPDDDWLWGVFAIEIAFATPEAP